ncbi:hypothetical protein AB1287_22065, partial [Enterobacter asburiae]
VTLKVAAFEGVHVLLRQQKKMMSLSPPDFCNRAASAGFFCTNDFTTGSAENLCLQGKILVTG